MAEAMNFRSSLGGFNKEDVVHYLEHIKTKHQNQINQLTCELEELRAQSCEDQSELVASLQAENAALTLALEEANAKLQAMEASAAVAAPAAEVPAPQAPTPEVVEELETYRRAERIEREARERAELVYFQASNVLKEANSKVDIAMSDLTEVADKVMTQLTQLQVSASNSKIALQDAASILNTIRPNR